MLCIFKRLNWLVLKIPVIILDADISGGIPKFAMSEVCVHFTIKSTTACGSKIITGLSDRVLVLVKIYLVAHLFVHVINVIKKIK